MDRDVAENEDGAAEMRSKLLKRLAMAGALVAVLLGILATFDYLATPSEENDAPIFLQPVPVPPKKEITQPVVVNETLPEPPVTPVEAEPDVPPPPVVESPPVVEEGKVAPNLERKAPAAPAPAPAPKPVPATSAVVEKTPPAVVPEETAPASVDKPAANKVEVVKPEVSKHPEPRPTAQVVPAAPAVPNGFVLQAGVFSSIKRAEELHAQLTLSGVPSTLETRVQVGPFRTRQEAEAAQAKLKELGVQTILVQPKGKN